MGYVIRTTEAGSVIWLLRSAMCDLLPGGAGLPPLADLEPEVFLRRLRAETTWLTWIGLCGGALIWLLTPVLTLGVPLPAVWLGAAARDRHANALAGTRFYLLRQAFFLLKMYASMAWGQHPAARAALALAPYPPDPGTFRTA